MRISDWSSDVCSSDLWDCSRRLDIQEFNFFTVALAIQSETGGNLAETLANLSDVLRRRRQLKLKIKALSSEAKASAYIIGSLPFRSEEHTSELHSLMRISYAVFCLKQKQ